jgi:hypothetical protein
MLRWRRWHPRSSAPPDLAAAKTVDAALIDELADWLERLSVEDEVKRGGSYYLGLAGPAAAGLRSRDPAALNAVKSSQTAIAETKTTKQHGDDNAGAAVGPVRGRTLLHCALRLRNYSLALSLIEAGADLSTQEDDTGCTALMHACRNTADHEAVAAVLRAMCGGSNCCGSRVHQRQG